MKYLTVQDIIEFNVLALTLIRTKKADKSEVLSYQKLRSTVNECEELEGELYDKAAFLLKAIIKQHAFASGNRRTAFVATKHFVTENGMDFKIEDSAEYAKIMTGIRENYYQDIEIKDWIKNGSIRKFERKR